MMSLIKYYGTLDKKDFNISDTISFTFECHKFLLIFPSCDNTIDSFLYQKEFFSKYPMNNINLNPIGKDVFTQFDGVRVEAVVSSFSIIDDYPFLEFDIMQKSKIRNAKIESILF